MGSGHVRGQRSSGGRLSHTAQAAERSVTGSDWEKSLHRLGSAGCLLFPVPSVLTGLFSYPGLLL